MDARPTLTDLETLSRSPLLAGVPPATTASFVARGRVREIPAGTRFWKEGDASDGKAYVLVSGSAGVTIEKEPVVELGAGDIFGEYALVSEGPRSATVETLEGCRCLEFGKDAVADLLSQDGASLADLIIRRVKENSSANRGTFRDDLYVGTGDER